VKIKFIIFVIAILLTLSAGYCAYKYFYTPVVLPTQTTEEAQPLPKVKHVKKVSKQINVKVYDREDLESKVVLPDQIKKDKDQEVGAMTQLNSETGHTVVTSTINTKTGENKLWKTEVRSKFMVKLDPALYLDARILGSPDSDLARLGIKTSIIRSCGSKRGCLDLVVKGEVAYRNNNMAGSGTQTPWGVYGSVEYHPFK